MMKIFTVNNITLASAERVGRKRGTQMQGWQVKRNDNLQPVPKLRSQARQRLPGRLAYQSPRVQG
jgi:hypothetical protein